MYVLAKPLLTNYQATPRRAAASPPSATRVLLRIGATLRLWARRIRDRQALARLDWRDLRDIGATPSEVYQEMKRPFWR